MEMLACPKCFTREPFCAVSLLIMTRRLGWVKIQSHFQASRLHRLRLYSCRESQIAPCHHVVMESQSREAVRRTEEGPKKRKESEIQHRPDTTHRATNQSPSPTPETNSAPYSRRTSEKMTSTDRNQVINCSNKRRCPD
ncbi:uncharacterized protein LOC144048689 [Vanacampus margaritifer]